MHPTTAPWSLAIDFGTSNTSAAVLHRDHVQAIRLESDSDLLPSCVLVIDGEIRVGRAALNQARLHPERFEASPKRRLAERTVRLGRDDVPTVDLVAAVLRRVQHHARAVMGDVAPSRVWLTHPENWPAQHIELLREATARAGFPPAAIRTVSEPIAAAQHYAATTEVSPGSRIVVCDVGGGTVDAAVLRADGQGAFTVLGAEGDPYVGGSDFDDRITEWVLEQLVARGEHELATRLTSTHSSALRARLALRDTVRAAKEDLSQHASVTIGVIAGDLESTLTLTRDEFDHLVDAEVRRAVELVERVLARTQSSGGVDALYLTGGASVTPVLVRRLRETTGRIPATLDDPKLVCAKGALRTVERVAAPDARGAQASASPGRVPPMGGQLPPPRPSRPPQQLAHPAPRPSGPAPQRFGPAMGPAPFPPVAPANGHPAVRNAVRPVGGAQAGSLGSAFASPLAWIGLAFAALALIGVLAGLAWPLRVPSRTAFSIATPVALVGAGLLVARFVRLGRAPMHGKRGLGAVMVAAIVTTIVAVIGLIVMIIATA